MNTMNVLFNDLRTQHQMLESEFIEVFKNVLRSDRFIGGEYLENFEKTFASFCGCKFAIGVGNGTDALRFSLIACGVKNGDIVLTVPNSFIATSEAISQAGGIPVFIDIDEKTSNMSIEKLQKYLQENCFLDSVTGETINTKCGKAIRAILPVHLYGRMCDMDSIMDIAKTYNLVVIEDACQAHGAKYFSKVNNTWMNAGTIGRAAAFSFYPGKNLGAFGEAGAITTNDPQIAEMVKMLRDHGQQMKYIHEIEGYNGRLDSLQAAVLTVKLKYLNEWNEKRDVIAKKYNERFVNVNGIAIHPIDAGYKSSNHLYVIRYAHRDALKAFLAGRNIETGLHYPVPLHLQKAYRSLGYRSGSFPVSEKSANELLSLPMHPFLTEDHITFVTEMISQFCKNDSSNDTTINMDQ